MKKILVLGDSLPLPRSKPQSCHFEHTWPFLLKQQFEVHQVCIGGGTIKDLFRQVEYHKAYEPDIVVLQCGIVDCAPRALGKFELEIVKHLWIFGRIIQSIVKRKARFLRRIRNKTYTSPKDFKLSLSKIKKEFPKSAIYALGIIPSCKEYELCVPGISLRIEQYNKFLEAEFKSEFISLEFINRECIMTDFIHLNEKGHRFIHDEVCNFLMTHNA